MLLDNCVNCELPPPTPSLNCKPPPPKPPTSHMHSTSPVGVIKMQQVSLNSDQSYSQNHQTANYKKPRTQFTPQQLLYLEERFLESHFPSVKAKENMAKEIELTPYHIQIWFQNRRARFRRRERRSKAKESMKCEPKPPSFWPQHLPFDSNFTGVLSAGKEGQSTGTPSPSVSEPLKVESEPFSSPETPQLDNGLPQESPKPPLTTGETTISGMNTSPLSSPVVVKFAGSKTLTHSSQSPTVSVSIQHHSSNMESSWNNQQPTYSADTTPASITPPSASPVSAHSLPSSNDIREKLPYNCNHPPYSSVGSVPPTTATTTFYSSATAGYTCMPFQSTTLATATHCSIDYMAQESTTVSTPTTFCRDGCVSTTSCCTADCVPPQPAAMPSHCSIEYVTPNPSATMTYSSVDRAHPVPTVKTTYRSIDHAPPVGYIPPKTTTVLPPVVNAARAVRAGTLDSAPWMESISSTALSLMSKAHAAVHTGEPVNHNPLPPSRPVTHPGAPTADHLSPSRPVTYPGAPAADHLLPSRLVTHLGTSTSERLPLSRPITHPGAPTADHLPLSRSVIHPGAPTADHLPLSRSVIHLGISTSEHLPPSRPITHPGIPTADHLPPSGSVIRLGTSTADHLPLSRLVSHPSAPTADHLPLPRPVTYPGATIADHLALSRLVTHPGAPTADHLPPSTLVAYRGAPITGTVTPSLMTCSCNSATCASRQGSVISGALEKAEGLTFAHDTAENHQNPPFPSLIHAEPPMQLADILGEEWDFGKEWDLLEPILAAEYQQTYVEPEPPMPTPSNTPYFHMHQQNSYHEPTPLSGNHVPVDRPMLVQNPTAPPFTSQWQSAVPNLLPQFKPIPPARNYDKLSSTVYHFNYSGPLQSSRVGYTNPFPLHSRVPLMFGASTNGSPYTLSSS